MLTNRVITREEAANLDLDSRIELERQLTDAEQICLQPPKIVPFEQYRSASPWRKFMFEYSGPVENKTVLDIGCGYHPTPIIFALAGARKVYACDVSANAVEYMRKWAAVYGVANRIDCFVAPAERLPIPNQSIEIAHGEGVLHHLEMELAADELSRVMLANARGIFKDPLGQNRLLEFARDHLSYRWKKHAKGTDRPLTFSVIRRFGEHFSHFEYRGFGFTSALAIWLTRERSRTTRLAHRLDDWILNIVPPIHYHCRFVVTCIQR